MVTKLAAGHHAAAVHVDECADIKSVSVSQPLNCLMRTQWFESVFMLSL